MAPSVVVQPTLVRPDPSVRADYGDNGDLWIQQRVEVKHRPGLDFTGLHDFPYPTVIVDVAHNYDRARTKPYFYVICNRAMDGALIVPCKATRARWTKTVKRDNHAGREREFYECPVSLCQYHEIRVD